ncbi:unnamed protein product, partial [marine sediment metagenome]
MRFEAGIYDDISNADYHASEGISKSGLDLIAKCPKKYWHKYINPERMEKEQSDAFLIGQATHTAILEPEK